MVSSPSEEHEEIVYKLLEATRGFKEPPNGKEGELHIPDLITSDGIEIEVEMLNKKGHLNKKATRWKPNQKRILVVSVPKESFDKFNAVLFMQEDKFLLVKNERCKNTDRTKLKKDKGNIPKILRGGLSSQK